MNQNEKKLFHLLKLRYAAPEFALIPQVRDGVGFTKTVRTADAIAIGLWPSRGIEVYGFEFKSNRSDWTKELKDPAKAEEIAQFCDYWIIVAADKSIVHLEEVPKTWGLLVPRGEKSLVSLKQPEKMKAKPLDRLFIASILRRVDQVKSEVLQERYAEGKEEGLKLAENRHESALKRAQDEADSLSEAIAEFEKEAGISIRENWKENIWASPEERGRAFRAILNGDHLKELGKLKDLHKRVGEAIKKHEQQS